MQTYLPPFTKIFETIEGLTLKDFYDIILCPIVLVLIRV
ncbi:hypothetical protein UF75_5183 [Desulfosporosinus sp. I2]|nr:hypothetical protein UF75_5183 [Desulfosporosinus sp. I2]